MFLRIPATITLTCLLFVHLNGMESSNGTTKTEIDSNKITDKDELFAIIECSEDEKDEEVYEQEDEAIDDYDDIFEPPISKLDKDKKEESKPITNPSELLFNAISRDDFKTVQTLLEQKPELLTTQHGIWLPFKYAAFIAKDSQSYKYIKRFDFIYHIKQNIATTKENLKFLGDHKLEQLLELLLQAIVNNDATMIKGFLEQSSMLLDYANKYLSNIYDVFDIPKPPVNKVIRIDESHPSIVHPKYDVFCKEYALKSYSGSETYTNTQEQMHNESTLVDELKSGIVHPKNLDKYLDTVRNDELLQKLTIAHNKHNEKK